MSSAGLEAREPKRTDLGRRRHLRALTAMLDLSAPARRLHARNLNRRLLPDAGRA